MGVKDQGDILNFYVGVRDSGRYPKFCVRDPMRYPEFLCGCKRPVEISEISGSVDYPSTRGILVDVG